jgi:hypothetical protein
MITIFERHFGPFFDLPSGSLTRIQPNLPRSSWRCSRFSRLSRGNSGCGPSGALGATTLDAFETPETRIDGGCLACWPGEEGRASEGGARSVPCSMRNKRERSAHVTDPAPEGPSPASFPGLRRNSCAPRLVPIVVPARSPNVPPECDVRRLLRSATLRGVAGYAQYRLPKAGAGAWDVHRRSAGSRGASRLAR